MDNASNVVIFHSSQHREIIDMLFQSLNDFHGCLSKELCDFTATDHSKDGLGNYSIRRTCESDRAGSTNSEEHVICIFTCLLLFFAVSSENCIKSVK